MPRRRRSYEWLERNMEEMRKDSGPEMWELTKALYGPPKKQLTIDRFSPDFARPDHQPNPEPMAKNLQQLQQPIADLVQARRRAARKRERLDELKEELDTLIRQFHGDLATEIADVTEQLKNLEAEEKEAEGILRDETIEYYTETGDKKPHPGVEVREFTGVAYNEQDAFERGEQLGVLQLDKKRFEKMAKASIVDGEINSPLFDFCTVVIEGKVYLSKEISIDLNLPKAA